MDDIKNTSLVTSGFYEIDYNLMAHWKITPNSSKPDFYKIVNIGRKYSNLTSDFVLTFSGGEIRLGPEKNDSTQEWVLQGFKPQTFIKFEPTFKTNEVEIG